MKVLKSLLDNNSAFESLKGFKQCLFGINTGISHQEFIFRLSTPNCSWVFDIKQIHERFNNLQNNSDTRNQSRDLRVINKFYSDQANVASSGEKMEALLAHKLSQRIKLNSVITPTTLDTNSQNTSPISFKDRHLGLSERK